MSAVAVVATLFGLGALYYGDEITELHDASTARKKAIVEAFGRSFWPQFATYYRNVERSEIQAKRVRNISKSIDLAVNHLTQGNPVRDFRVVLSEGRVIYSMSGRDLGQVVPVVGGLATAVNDGAIHTEIEKYGVILGEDGGWKPRYISETFFPIHDESGRLEVAVQITDDVTASVERAKNNILRVLGPSLAILLALLFSILLFSLNADRIIGTQRDALRRSAERHKESEEKFRAIADYSHDLELWITPDKEILWINPAVQRLIGDTVRVAMGARDYLLSVTYKDDRRKVSRWIDDSITGGQAENVEFRLNTIAGERKWVAASYQPIRSKGDTALGSRWSIRDISERKSMEAAVRTSELRFRTVANSAGDAIVCINDRGQITFWNPAARSIFGYDESDILGKNITALIPDRFRSNHSRGFSKTVRGGETGIMNKVVEVVGLRSNGEEFPIELSVSPARAEGQHFYTAIVRDVTARKETEEHMRGTLDALTRTNAELERFAFVASHDPQEPSRSVVSFCQLLERRLEGSLDPEAKEFLDYVVDGAKRMRTLVSDLLDYSHVGQKDGSFSPVDVDRVLDQVTENLSKHIEERGVTIVAEDLPRISGDATQIMQLLQNLISNAIKFVPMDRTPTIRINGQAVNGDYVIAVTDNGIGIDEKYQSQIFSPFKRLHTIKEYPGTGIGLAICQRIVERHGGRIWVESEPGTGSTFRCSLPAAD